jgi:acetylornithine deacetylase
MVVVRAHKGKVAKCIEVRGKGGHSSLPHKGVNAAVWAARVTLELERIGRELEARISAEPFDPPWSTLHIGILQSGTALNLIPDRAQIAFEIRFVPETIINDVLTHIEERIAVIRHELQARAPEADVLVSTIAAYPGLSMNVNDPAVQLARKLTDCTAVPGIVSFGTEAGLFQAAGIPTLVCGPGHISRAHKADEWIGIDELMAASRMMTRVADLTSTGSIQGPP